MNHTLANLLTPVGYRVLQIRSPEDAHSLLTHHEEIVFIFADVDGDISVDQAQQRLAENRAYIAWARLPAAILLPATLIDLQEALLDSGVMGTMFFKPLDSSDLVAQHRRSRAL